MTRARRSLVSAILAVVLAMLTIGSAGMAAPAGVLPPGVQRPDIVVLVIDDLPQMDDRLWERLPTIRRLFLESGVRFTDAIANDPLCCPARATLLTGQRAIHHGVLWNDARLFDPSVTVATELRGVGYWTGIFGKYFNQTRYLRDRSPPGWNRAFIHGGGYWGYDAWLDGRRISFGVDDADHSTVVTQRQAVRGIRAAPAGRPWLLWLAPTAVHAGPDQRGVMSQYGQPAPADRDAPACADIPPWETAATRETDLSDKPAYIRDAPASPTSRSLRRTCATLLSVDRLLAKVLDELRARGRPEPLVILTSDNGMAWGAHRWKVKRVPYATPIPLFIRWPTLVGELPSTVRTTVSNVDLAGTLCAIGGCTMGPFANGFGVDGISLLPLLRDVGSVSGGADAGRGRDGQRGIGRTPQGLITGLSLGRTHVIEEHRSDMASNDPPLWRGVRTTDESPLGRWVYTEYVTGERELYDISGGPCWTWTAGDAGDPCQLENLAGDPGHAEIEQQLADIVATFD